MSEYVEDYYKSFYTSTNAIHVNPSSFIASDPNVNTSKSFVVSHYGTNTITTDTTNIIIHDSYEEITEIAKAKETKAMVFLILNSDKLSDAEKLELISCLPEIVEIEYDIDDYDYIKIGV